MYMQIYIVAIRGLDHPQSEVCRVWQFQNLACSAIKLHVVFLENGFSQVW